jgi:hygromycin-B 4-O-kinase
MTGGGPFDDRGAAPFQSWRDWLLSIMDPVCSDLPIMSGVTNRKLLDLVLPRFAALTENCPEVRKLVHGDFGSNNVLAEGECITSVLDWSEAMIGDPAYDIANVLFWRTWLPCMEELAAWFERAGTIDRTGRKRLLCYALRIGLREVYENVRDGNHGMGGWALNRCNELLQGG